MIEAISSSSTGAASFSVLPERVLYGIEEFRGGSLDENGPVVHEKVYTLSELYSKHDALTLALDPNLAVTVLERRSAPNAILPLYVPVLGGVTLQTLLDMRSDEPDAVETFHFALGQIIREMEISTSAARLTQLLERTDHEVHAYESQLRSIRKRGRRSLSESVVGAATLGVSLVLPHEIASMVVAVFGGWTIREGASSAWKSRDALVDLRQSPFFVAARAARLVDPKP